CDPQDLNQRLTQENVDARLARESALLHQAAIRIAVVRAIELESERSEPIEEPDFFEHFNGVVLDLNAGAKFPDFGRPLVNASSPRGTSMASAFAVFRLMACSTDVGCRTGGLAMLGSSRICPT